MFCICVISRRSPAISAAPAAVAGICPDAPAFAVTAGFASIWPLKMSLNPASTDGAIAGFVLSVVASITMRPLRLLVEIIIASGPSFSQISSIAVAESAACTVNVGIVHPPFLDDGKSAGSYLSSILLSASPLMVAMTLIFRLSGNSVKPRTARSSICWRIIVDNWRRICGETTRTA